MSNPIKVNNNIISVARASVRELSSGLKLENSSFPVMINLTNHTVTDTKPYTSKLISYTSYSID